MGQPVRPASMTSRMPLWIPPSSYAYERIWVRDTGLDGVEGPVQVIG